MDFGKQALARALQDQSLSAFVDRGVRPEMMPDADSGAALKWLLDFHQQHGAVPGPQTFATAFPAYPLGYAAEPASFYISHIVRGYVRGQAIETVLQSTKGLTGDDPFKIIQNVSSKFNKLSLLSASRTERDIRDNTTDRYTRYLQRKTQVGITGIPTPWASLDDITQGWQEEDYVLFVARMKVGKTWMMLRLAHAAWMAGRSVLFINKELPDVMMERRFDALHHRLNYGRFREGLLTDEEQRRYKAGLDTIASGGFPQWKFVHGAMTVSAIGAKVEELDPGIVFVDGAYLLMDEDGGRAWWEKNMNISRGLKRLPQLYKRPLIATTQLARTGDTKKNKEVELTPSDVGGSDAFAQDADSLFAMSQTDDQRQQKVLDIIPLVVREAPPDTLQVEWNFETMESKDLGKKAKFITVPDSKGTGTTDAKVGDSINFDD